mgnify:CR=1 FL=1|tara:strand:- start:73841 stop:75877 length:2037 start_codon:yes stop_codon:yes gene_type:complete
MAYIVDIDTGGTFTDGFIANGLDVRTVKVPTTPHDLTLCFLDCIKVSAEAYGLSLQDFLYETEIIRFSNTIGTNTIIQRDGAKIGLLVSKGMAALAPTSTSRDKSALVEPDMVIEIDEEVDPAGYVQLEPDRRQVLAAAQSLIDSGARVLVVALSGSERNPANEQRVRAIIKQEYPREYLGSVSVFLASDISARTGLAQRLNTAVLNAYIHPKLARLLYKAGEELRQNDYNHILYIGHNNGSVARVAKTRAINTYNSGPAAGLLGAREIGRLYGIDNLISTDMGGTSFDIGYVRNGIAGYALSPDVEGFTCNLPMMSILALGTGGGSIAYCEDGEVRVGPQSAGALPGPACFNLGGIQPTVTDANLVLGLLDPEYFLGGKMVLDVERARTAIQSDIAQVLGVSVEEAAFRIKQTVDRDMGSAVAKVAGQLPARHPRVVVAYGGAGGIHACDIAAAANVDKVIITPFSAVSSAYSSSLLDPGHLYYRRAHVAIDSDLLRVVLDELIPEMRREAERDMRGEGYLPEQLQRSLQLFIAGPGAEQEVIVYTSDDFHHDARAVSDVVAQAREALTAVGASCADGDLQLVTLALMVTAPAPHYVLNEQPETSSDPAKAFKQTRSIYSPSAGKFIDTAIYDRDALPRGAVINGPALAESENTTLFIAEGWRMSVDRFNNAILEEA